MKKYILLSIFLTLFFSLTVFAQKNGKGNGNGNGNNGNDEKGRTNLILPHGYIGLGTLSPTERLEVIGNVKVSNSIFANDIDAVGLSATSFNVREDASIGRDLIIMGNVGVGLQNPSERLEINGNLKVVNGIFSSSIETESFTGVTGLFSTDLDVNQNFYVGGLTGLGITEPTERLEVAGNIKATEGVYSEFIETNIFTGNNGTFSGDLSISNNIYLDGLLGIGVTDPSQKIDVMGSIKASETLFSSGLETGTGLFSSDVSIEQNLLISGNIGLGISSPTEKIDVDGNIKASGNILSESLETTTFYGSEGSFSNNLSIGQNLLTNGNIGIGVTEPTEKLDILGNIKATGSVNAQSIQIEEFSSANGDFSGALSVGQNFTVNGLTGLGVVSPTERLDVAGNVKASGSLLSESIETATFSGSEGTFNNNLSVGQNLSVSGLTGIGVANPTEKLDVDGNIKASGSINAQSLSIEDFNGSNGSFTGNLIVDGNIGIGIANPTDKLEVDGTIKSTSLTATDISSLNADFGGNVSIGQGMTVTGDADFTAPVTMGDLTIQNNLDLQNELSVGSTLGVNVASPQATFHVGGDGIFDGNITAVKLIVQDLEVANLDLGNQNGDQVAFEQDMFVEGNVGIGTEKTQGYKLSVNGKIRASDDIRVYPSVEWADYVFKEDYQLASLNEVETFIQENNHLPDMPSSEEVKESGIDLGEMDAKLLQKIEELTLYMLELKKENEKLNKEVQQLKEKMAE